MYVYLYRQLFSLLLCVVVLCSGCRHVIVEPKCPACSFYGREAMEHIRKKEFKKATELLDPYRLRYSEVCQEAYAVLMYKTKGDLKAVQIIEKQYVKYGWLEFAEAYEVLALYYFNLKEKRKVVVKLIVKALNKPKSFHDQLHNFRLYRFLVSVLLSLGKKKDAKEIVQDMIKRWPSKKNITLRLLK